MKPRSYALIAADVFSAEAAYVALHAITGAEYAGLTHTRDVVIDALMTALWLTEHVSSGRHSYVG